MPRADGGRCPCGTGLAYAECCGPAHDGTPPATAEALMRSRYSAFARGDTAYLLRSWDPATRPRAFDPDHEVRWTALDIVGTERGGLFDTEGVVEFVAHFRQDGESGAMRERSRFTRRDGAWVYRNAI
jgi:SEC-C motif domain protein